jgi:hypothetical protein
MRCCWCAGRGDLNVFSPAPPVAGGAGGVRKARSGKESMTRTPINTSMTRTPINEISKFEICAPQHAQPNVRAICDPMCASTRLRRSGSKSMGVPEDPRPQSRAELRRAKRRAAEAKRNLSKQRDGRSETRRRQPA